MRLHWSTFVIATACAFVFGMQMAWHHWFTGSVFALVAVSAVVQLAFMDRGYYRNRVDQLTSRTVAE